MTKLTVDDGYAADGPAQTSTFDYTGLRYDFVHRTSLGFATVTTRELSPSRGDAAHHPGVLRQPASVGGGVVDPHRGPRRRPRPGIWRGHLQAATETTWTVLRGAGQEPVTAAGLAAMDPDELLTVWARPLPVAQTSTRVIDGRTQTIAHRDHLRPVRDPGDRTRPGRPGHLHRRRDHADHLRHLRVLGQHRAAHRVRPAGQRRAAVAVRDRPDLPDLGAGPRDRHRPGRPGPGAARRRGTGEPLRARPADPDRRTHRTRRPEPDRSGARRRGRGRGGR